MTPWMRMFKVDINEMFENGMEEFLSNMYFDIYEDYDTGATFAVPFGASVTYQDNLFHVTKENSFLAFAPINASSFKEASQALELFVDGVLAEYPGAKQALNFEDEYEIDEYNEYLDGAIFREVYEDGEKYLLIVGGSAMGSDLACMLMVCPLPREMDEAQAREFIEFALATEIISFSGH